MWQRIKDYLMRPKKAVDIPIKGPTTHVIEANIKFSPTVIESSTPVPYRVGMWVMAGKNHASILHKIQYPNAEIHHVDWTTGETTIIEVAPLMGLKQAKFAEIPACRRGFTAETALKLGYK